jgi:hypothetical protein
MTYKLDLHIHTKASNCFKSDNLDNDGVNRSIIQQAKNMSLDMIAVTDHYTLKNYSGIKAIGAKENIKVIPGMELSLKTNLPDKLSLIIIFSENISMDPVESKLLSELKIPDEEKGNGRFLIDMKLSDVMNILNKHNGLIISAHQDKNESRMLSIPALIKHGICLFDLRYPEKKEGFMERYSRYNIVPLTFSDCHEVNNVGKYCMSLSLRECSLDGFKGYLENILRANYED